MKKRAVISLSGGMDSTGLLVRLLTEGYTVTAVSFNYGQKHSIEIDKAKANIEYLGTKGPPIEHHIVDLSSVMSLFSSSLIKGGDDVPEGHYEKENMKTTVVPNRNAIFSSIIYGLALSISKDEGMTDVRICLGIHSGDHAIYPDCTPGFRDTLEQAFKIGNWESQYVSYYTPYINSNKTLILKDTLKNCKALGLDFNTVLRNTITSYNPDSKGRSSGKTGSDIERIEAFINIGRQDPIEYVEPWGEIVRQTELILKSQATSER